MSAATMTYLELRVKQTLILKKDRSNQKYAYYKKLIKSSEFSNEDSGQRKGVFYCFETDLLYILFCIGIIRIAM